MESKSIEHAIMSAYTYRNPDSYEEFYEVHRKIVETGDFLPDDLIRRKDSY